MPALINESAEPLPSTNRLAKVVLVFVSPTSIVPGPTLLISVIVPLPDTAWLDGLRLNKPPMWATLLAGAEVRSTIAVPPEML